MTREEAKERFEAMARVALENAQALEELRKQAERLVPGMKVTLLARDAEIPVGLASSIAILSEDNLVAVAQALLQNALRTPTHAYVHSLDAQRGGFAE